MSTHRMKIGVIGFGVMGVGMARNLVKHGHTVYGFSRTQSKVEALSEEGVIPTTLETLAETSDVVLLSVSDGPAVESLLFGERAGIVRNLQRGALIIDTTTTAPREALSFYERCAAAGIHFIDSPVTGGDVGARNGTLTCMCGATPEGFEMAQPILRCIGSKIVLVGSPGSGQRMKAVNQVAVALGIVAMTEALVFAANQGLDRAMMLDTLQGGAAGSWALANYAPRLLRGDFQPGFSAAHMLKDINIALSEVRDPVTLEATEWVKQKFEQLVSQHPGVGNHALIKTYTQ
jgi:3-hydroxyisobutyrate dehydrogenase